MTTPPKAEIERLLRYLTALLCTVGVLALTFTAVNVTLFASSRNVPLPIALLLDPMLALTLTAVLYADARLAAWGLRPPTWSTALRWWAGTTAATMNTWNSLWPDGHIGWPHHADPAAVLLHLVPCLLLIGLAEAIAAYRRLLTKIDHPDPQSVTAPRPEPGSRCAEPPPHPAPHPAPACELTRDDELLIRAHALDAAVRQRTGHPVSIRQLRRQLHLGQDRARALRTRLDTTHTTDTPAPDTAPQHSLDQERSPLDITPLSSVHGRRRNGNHRDAHASRHATRAHPTRRRTPAGDPPTTPSDPK